MSVEAQTWWHDAELDRERWRALIEPVVERAALAFDRGRFPHGLLLVGPPGLGRELAAVEIATMLTCPASTGPWCECHSCDRARRGSHPDVVGVFRRKNKKTGKLKKHICIDWVRDIVEAAPGKPFESNTRVWILSSAEPSGLGLEAANAFLKTLEEPSGHVRFILLAANPGAVLPTIRSRCQQLTLPGASVVADGEMGEEIPPELAASVLAGVKLDGVLAEVRSAIDTGIAGESRHLLRLPYLVGNKVNPFEVVAAVATEMATGADDTERGEDLVRLAADLLATDRRCRTLNLNVDRQLVSCLLRWFQEL